MKPAEKLETEGLAQRLLEGSINFASSFAEGAFQRKSLRDPVLKKLEQHVISRSNEKTYPGCPRRVLQDQADMLRAIFASSSRALDRGQISPKVLRRLLKTLLANVVLGKEYDRRIDHADRQFAEKHNGKKPPSLLVISPTNACNLHCTGCYANAGSSPQRLEWETLDRIVTEAKELWGVRFFTISGGEPLMYRSQGKQLLDLAERHNDCYFQAYTNGCFIDRLMAERMANAGNFLPAISVEGLEARTDARRGSGMFQKILAAMANLQEAGVPFGISVTATRENAVEILSDEFVDFFFTKQQAIFGWLFQYMPIGRSYTVDLVVTPQQRLWMWERTWQIIRRRKIMFADFWNCGTVTQGCIAAGHSYFYIDWTGKVMPCVFVPYSAANIHTIYKNGGTLDDIYELPYFRAIRQWQSNYSRQAGQGQGCGNYLLPCSLRDHYAIGRGLIAQYHPEPEDTSAAEAISDPEYAMRMVGYDAELQRVFDPVWEQDYINGDEGQSRHSGNPSKHTIISKSVGEDEESIMPVLSQAVDKLGGLKLRDELDLCCQDNVLTCRDDEDWKQGAGDMKEGTANRL